MTGVTHFRIVMNLMSSTTSLSPIPIPTGFHPLLNHILSALNPAPRSLLVIASTNPNNRSMIICHLRRPLHERLTHPRLRPASMVRCQVTDDRSGNPAYCVLWLAERLTAVLHGSVACCISVIPISRAVHRGMSGLDPGLESPFRPQA